MIYLECFADEALVKSFGATSKMIKHAFSKGEVCNMLDKTTGAIGIVDEDPQSGKPSYEKEMRNHKIHEDAKVIICEHRGSGNKLILIRPRLEEFIIRISKEHRVDMESYKLSSDPDKLHDELSFRKNQYKFNGFRNLLFDLLKIDPTLISLKKYIS